MPFNRRDVNDKSWPNYAQAGRRTRCLHGLNSWLIRPNIRRSGCWTSYTIHVHIVRRTQIEARLRRIARANRVDDMIIIGDIVDEDAPGGVGLTVRLAGRHIVKIVVTIGSLIHPGIKEDVVGGSSAERPRTDVKTGPITLIHGCVVEKVNVAAIGLLLIGPVVGAAVDSNKQVVVDIPTVIWILGKQKAFRPPVAANVVSKDNVCASRRIPDVVMLRIIWPW